MNTSRNYWTELLHDFEGEGIACDHSGSGYLPEKVAFPLPESESVQLLEICGNIPLPVCVYFAAVVNVLLYKVQCLSDIVLSMPGLGEGSQNEMPAVFLRTKLDDRSSFRDVLDQVKHNMELAYRNQPFHVPDHGGASAFSTELLNRYALFVHGLHTPEQLYYYEAIAKPEMLISVRLQPLHAEVQYNAAIHDPAKIKALCSCFCVLLRQVIHQPMSLLQSLRILDDEKIASWLAKIHNTKHALPKVTLHQLFEEQVQRAPGATALIFKGQHVSYHRLNSMAEQIAGAIGHLTEQRTGEVVAVLATRSIEMIASVIAVLKTGNAYLPVDPALPSERINYLLADAGVNAIVTFHDKSLTLPDHLRCLNVGALDWNTAGSFAPKTLNVRDSAYVIYTSGTTGQPKGIKISHESIVNTLLCRREEYKIGPGLNCLHFFSFSFDGFLTSMFTPLISGATVIMLSDAELADMTTIPQIINRYDVHHFIATPSLYRVLLSNATQADMRSLRNVTLAGEVIEPELVQESIAINPAMEISIEYGVTECAVLSTLRRNQQEEKLISIGYPAWNTEIFILNKRGELMPPHISGEICIAGTGVGSGYINRSDLTAAKFIHVPELHDGIIYKSGDLGKLDDDGALTIKGRADQQVKFHGYRIELAEVECQLNKHPEIETSAVILKNVTGKGESLCAFYVSDRQIPVRELFDWLDNVLPYYMVPSYVTRISAMPVNSSGKVDKQKLQEHPLKTELDEGAAPALGNQKILYELWKDVLKVGDFSIDDNFFHLGGNSFLTVEAMNRINKQFNTKIPPALLYEYNTIRKLNDYLNKGQSSKQVDTGLLTKARKTINLMKGGKV